MKTSPALATICILGIAAALAGVYLGALAPLWKAQAFIAAEQNVHNVRTVDDFKANFDRMFNVYSPVGTEEVTKFLGGNMVGIISSQSEPVARDLVQWFEPHLFKDEVRHLMLAGQLRQILWQQYGHDEDFQAAVAFNEKAHEIGPDLPPPLYNLFGLYQAKGDKANTQRIAKLILANWNDPKVAAALK